MPLFCLIALLAQAPLAPAAQPSSPPPSAWFGTDAGFPQHPAVSPDGSFIVYSDRGDLWAVPRSGGTASRLTSHPATEKRAAFSPDSSMLAFESDRDGATNIYMVPIAANGNRLTPSGPITRLTTSDRWQALSGFTSDGGAVLFHSYSDPTIFRAPLLYRAPIDGGPITRPTNAHGRWPQMRDGTLYFSRGNAAWERPAYRGSANRDVWSMNIESGEFTRLSKARSNEGQIFPRPDGSMAILSSANGQNDIWIIPKDGTFDEAENRTRLTPGDAATIGHGARDLSVSADGTTAVIGLWDGLQWLDLTDPNAALQPIEIRRSGDTAALNRRIERLDNKVGEVALHPSGDAVAVVARGEVLVRSTKDDHPTRRVTEGHTREKQIAWSPDGTRLWFTSDEGGDEAIWEATVTLAREDLAPEPDEPEPDDEQDEADDDAHLARGEQPGQGAEIGPGSRRTYQDIQPRAESRMGEVNLLLPPPGDGDTPDGNVDVARFKRIELLFDSVEVDVSLVCPQVSRYRAPQVDGVPRGLASLMHHKRGYRAHANLELRRPAGFGDGCGRAGGQSESGQCYDE